MQDFQVPQFIEDESKLVGPFSFAQIFILIGGSALAILIYNLFIKVIGIPIALIVLFLTILLAVGKVHNFPLYKMIVHIIKHFFLPKSYLWKQPAGKTHPSMDRPSLQEKEGGVAFKSNAPALNKENLEELSKILDKKNE